MAAVAAAATRAVSEPLEGNRAVASSMVGEIDAKGRTARRAPRAVPACASRMVGAGAASFLSARGVLRAARCSVSLMAGANGAHTLIAARELREALPFARGMVGASAARSQAAARKACMAGPSSVSPTEVGRGARCLNALKAQEVGRLSALGMVGASAANMTAVERAHKEEPISARNMGEASVAPGAEQGPVTASETLLVTALPGVQVAIVLCIILWWKTIASMGDEHWELLLLHVERPPDLKR